MKRVYVAGPYTKGDVAENVKKAIESGDILLHCGYAPYIPHLNHFWHFLKPHSYDDWMALDVEWLMACSALIRLAGESKGADLEVELAQKLHIPVYYGVSEFLEEHRP